MADVIKDENHVTTISALSYVDGTTIVPIQIDSATSGLIVDTINSVSTAAMNAARDGNHVTTLMGVDSVSGDPIPLFANPVTGGVLVDIS